MKRRIILVAVSLIYSNRGHFPFPTSSKDRIPLSPAGDCKAGVIALLMNTGPERFSHTRSEALR